MVLSLLTDPSEGAPLLESILAALAEMSEAVLTALIVEAAPLLSSAAEAFGTPDLSALNLNLTTAAGATTADAQAAVDTVVSLGGASLAQSAMPASTLATTLATAEPSGWGVTAAAGASTCMAAAGAISTQARLALTAIPSWQDLLASLPTVLASGLAVLIEAIGTDWIGDLIAPMWPDFAVCEAHGWDPPRGPWAPWVAWPPCSPAAHQPRAPM